MDRHPVQLLRRVWIQNHVVDVNKKVGQGVRRLRPRLQYPYHSLNPSAEGTRTVTQ